MKIVATTSLPVVARPNANRWNAARSRQNHNTVAAGGPQLHLTSPCSDFACSSLRNIWAIKKQGGTNTCTRGADTRTRRGKTHKQGEKKCTKGGNGEVHNFATDRQSHTQRFIKRRCPPKKSDKE